MQAVYAEVDLSALTRAALEKHPALQAQKELQDAAVAAIEGAKWQYWPTLSVGVEHADTRDPSYLGGQLVSTLRVQQPLWFGGRIVGNLDKAQAQALATHAEVEGTRQQFALRVLQAWSEAMVASNKLVAHEQSRTIHARLLGMVERRTQSGASAKADVELARSRLDGIDAELSATRAQRDTALDRLRLLTALPLPPEQLETYSWQLPPELPQSLEALLQAARDQSPQIARAQAQSQVAAAEVVIAKAALVPEVYLRAERQYGNFFSVNQTYQDRVFVGASTALGAGLSSLSGVDAAFARQRAAQQDIKTQQLTVDEQVQSDAVLVRTAQQRREILEKVRRLNEGVSESWERQFLAGRKQWQDIMSAAREQAQIELQMADAWGAQQLAGWRLFVLTQGVTRLLEMPRQARAPGATAAFALATATAEQGGKAHHLEVKLDGQVLAQKEQP